MLGLGYAIELFIFARFAYDGFFDELPCPVRVLDDLEHIKNIDVRYNKIMETKSMSRRKISTKRKQKKSASDFTEMKCFNCNCFGRINLSGGRYMVCNVCGGRGFFRVGCSVSRYLGDTPCTCTLCRRTDFILGVERILRELSLDSRSR